MRFANRPYAQIRVAELELLVQERPEGATINRAILAELQQHRTTPRAQALRQRIERILAGSAGDAEPVRRGTPLAADKPDPPTMPKAFEGKKVIDNAPTDILSAWTVMEVLSPATFVTPAALARDVKRLARFDRGLPWANGAAKGPPGMRLYFQIVLGSIQMPAAVDQLLERFGDNRAERPQARGEAALALVIVDRDGRPIPDACAVVSSFGWGLPRALVGDPRTLNEWPAAEMRIQAALHERLYREGEDGKPERLDEAAVDSAYRWLVDEFGLDQGLMKPPRFAVRSHVPFKSNEPPEPLLLNSFYLKDLATARSRVDDGTAPDTMRRFLGQIVPTERADLLNDESAIEAAVAPASFPPGRWPGGGRHPLVLMQQAAVNLAMAQKPGEILAVNGPPGTGKTTLLRDVVAALVTERAAAMASFDDPEQAFQHANEKLKLGGAWVHLYRLDSRLKGFEMLVASSNNKAVENVSGELPAIGAIAEDAADLRYFKPLADGLLDQESWGAIAAVLGNASNRAAFKERFWWAPDTGLFNYLKAIDGRDPRIELSNGESRPPRIVKEMGPPVDRREALRRWQDARRRFEALRAEVETTAAQVEALRRRVLHLPGLQRAWEAARAHGALRPGFISRLFGLPVYREWKREHRPLADGLARAATRAGDAHAAPAALARVMRRSPWLGIFAGTPATAIDSQLRPLLEALAADRAARPATVMDEAFFDGARRDIQFASPWFTAEEHRRRDSLFAAALDLHRAFIDAAAKPLRHNLGAALQVLDGKGLPDAAKDALIPDLWASLFLVVPALSTTFASVGTMLARLPSESLGWLLIDEAGQAAPQQAVGAILRARHAIVVGDPIQVPPVVMLPDRLTTAICRTFGVDAQRFAAPGASVQTLADAATAAYADFPTGIGSRTVGVPLLVHRRCSEPMFGIANSIAYENLMVHAKPAKPSPIVDVLGASRWIDVVSTGSDKFSPEEGKAAIVLLERLVQARVPLDLYLVTPFVQVADGLRRMIEESALLRTAVQDIGKWARERVGTIHTVQGREAEAVIFVLGAPNADQAGARNWAGKEPNLLNVAATRAKEAFYVIGDHAHWRGAGVFSTLAARLHRVAP